VAIETGGAQGATKGWAALAQQIRHLPKAGKNVAAKPAGLSRFVKFIREHQARFAALTAGFKYCQ